ncbi:MAG: NAD-dependent epimerase/dehydratase family protein [Bacteroidetes bacterium]|nr:MAG: NAD-dependent epimerase/dehydratase family protein [Bacteroidota bacterium]
MMKGTVFLTGSDGFLGSNLLRQLLAAGYQVRALVEPQREAATIRHLPVELVRGDISQPAAWQRAVKGCDYVIHAAADVGLWPLRSARQRAVNVQGTAHCLQAAQVAGVKRFVHVGTANSIGYGSMSHPGHEGLPYSCGRFGLGYMDTKYEAQQLVLQAWKESGFPALVVNPTFMLGPYDSTPGSNRMLLALYRQQVPGYAPGSKNYLYVGDAVEAIVNALQHGRPGQCYLLGHENLSYREAFGRMAGALGVKAPRLPMPRPAVLAYGRLGSFLGQLTGKAPKVSYPMARLACEDVCYSAQKAINELGLPQTPLEVAVKTAMAWFEGEGRNILHQA